MKADSIMIPYSLKNQYKKYDVNNVIFFEELCKFIISKIEDDEELLELYKSRQKMFPDSSLHLLAQDIIYAGLYYSGKSFLEGDNHERVTGKDNILDEIEYKPKHKKTSFKLNKVDYEAKQKVNKKIGDLGELFVLEYEKAKVKSYGLKSKKVERVSKTQGDVLGYDILSSDNNGNDLRTLNTSWNKYRPSI